MKTFETKSASGTVALGRRLAGRLKAGDCVALVGELGAGKTALVRGIALGMGLKHERLVSSPTFVLVQEYPCATPVYHVDLYRLRDAVHELAQLGLAEMLSRGVVLIEWADRAGRALPRPRWEVAISHTGRNSRRFDVRRVE
ncbi:MAG: tRNA (adenosine(37)-N6)-threonylcarbamoyltransferase complex ATPase subunit type 1 TsaE [Phycisphaerae bacterium]